MSSKMLLNTLTISIAFFVEMFLKSEIETFSLGSNCVLE